MAPVYSGDLFAKPTSDLLLEENVHQAAFALRDLGRSGGMTFKWIMAELQSYHVGGLFNKKTNLLDTDYLRPLDLWDPEVLQSSETLKRWHVEIWEARPWHEITIEVEDLFGKCKRGTMNKFMRFAETPPETTQPEYLAPRLMFIDFALEINRRRLFKSGNQDTAA